MSEHRTTEAGTTSLRVALLRGDDHHNLYLERLLAKNFDLVAIVSEPGKAQRHSIWRRRRWRDAAAVEYHRARRAIFRKNHYRRRYFDPAHDNFTTPSRPAPLVVRDVNDPRVPHTVSTANADICVITCTTFLTERTIREIEVPIINIHGGHLPDYRGCHCVFMALSDRRFDAVGSTIHFVDAGLDTGDIIEVARPAIRPTDDAERLYSRAERLAAQRLVELLTELEAGTPLPRSPQTHRGRLVLRRHRTPLHDLRHWIARKTGRFSLPMQEGSIPEHPWELNN